MIQKRFWCPRDCGILPKQVGRGWTAALYVSTWPTSLARRCCCISSSLRWPTATGFRSTVTARWPALLRMTVPALVHAREELLAHDLIAHEVRFTQVLSMPPPGQHRRDEPGQGLMQLGEILRQAIASTHSNQEGACHEGRLMGRNPPLGRDREALRLGYLTTTPLLTAHGRCGAQAGPAPHAPSRAPR